MIHWPTVSALPWRQRNSEIEAAVRVLLGNVPARTAISTWEFACRMLGEWPDGATAKTWPIRGTTLYTEAQALSEILRRMAPYLGNLCAHDGPEIKRYGRTWRRWNWYGQKEVA